MAPSPRQVNNPQTHANLMQSSISSLLKDSQEINFEIKPARKASPAPVVSTIFCEVGVSVIPCNPLIYQETDSFHRYYYIWSIRQLLRY